MDMFKEDIKPAAAIADANAWARACDTCRSTACAVFCQADSAYLCAGCDAQVHAANHLASRHERVWVCEACERAPAAFLCRADSASLCVACDAEVHSANPLASRHQRVPITGSFYDPSAAAAPPGGAAAAENHHRFFKEEDENEAASWLLFDHGVSKNKSAEIDDYLDLGEYNSCVGNQFGDGEIADEYNYYKQQQKYSFNHPHDHHEKKSSYGGGGGGGEDSVVPVNNQIGEQMQHQWDLQLGINAYKSTEPEYNRYDSFGHTVSVSSSDVGVVPESTNAAAASETPPAVAASQSGMGKGTIDLFSGPAAAMQVAAAAVQLSGTEREARVMRYREKKKARKFEKTIRYASRKAYAESRPRIKGRFAKRDDAVQGDENSGHMGMLMPPDSATYGLVPSF